MFMPEELLLPSMPGVRLAICALGNVSAPCRRRDRERDAVRCLVGHIFGTGAEYCHNADGSPYIAGSDKFISVSHSREHAVLAVSDTPGLGVDIEQMRLSQLRHVSERFLGRNELPMFADDRHLLWAWCAKEAVYKAAGKPGLSGPEIELATPLCDEACVGNRRFALSTVFGYSGCIGCIVVGLEVTNS